MGVLSVVADEGLCHSGRVATARRHASAAVKAICRWRRAMERTVEEASSC